MSQNNERLKNILSKSIIIDTLSHGPIPWTDDLIKYSDDMIAKGMNPWDIIPKVVEKFVKNLVLNDDYYKEYKEYWENSGVDCVSWTVGPLYSSPYSFEGVFHNFSIMTYLFDNRDDYLSKVLKADDITSAKKEGKKAVILNFQSMQHIGEDIDLVDLYYMQGMRVMQLTYNTKNLIGTGCTARRDRGLTDFGKEVVKRINDLGAIVDISHCGIQTTLDAIEVSNSPVIASHTFAKELYEHDRGKTDDIIKKLADKGGYIGVLTVPGFISNDPQISIDHWLDHIDYIKDLVGIDYVGIGTDFYGFSLPDNLAIKIGEFIEKLGFRPEHKASFLTKMKDFENYTKFPNLIKGLIKRGYTDQEIRKISGENFLRVFKEVGG
jgi:membrane dipeptidase